MDLSEYIWRSKRTSRDIAGAAECSSNTISNIKRRRSSPSLLLALKLVAASSGKISFPDLLSEEDEEEFLRWVYEKSKEEI